MFIKSLGTNDVRLANDRADPIRAELKARVERARALGRDAELPKFLRDLFELEIQRAKKGGLEENDDFFGKIFDDDTDEPTVGATVHAHPSGGLAAKLALPVPEDLQRGWRQLENKLLGKALLSPDRAKQEAAAGWAADFYFYETIGSVPRRDSRDYQRVLDECIKVLLDAAKRRVELEKGTEITKPRHPALNENEVSIDGNRATRDEGRLPVSEYFRSVYEPAWTGSAKVPAQVRASGPIRTYDSAKSPELIRDCMVGMNPQSNSATPYGQGWMIASSQNPNIASFAEVEAADGATKVRVVGTISSRYFVAQIERCV